MQPGHPADPLGQSRRAQSPTGLVHHLHIMMIFGPIVADDNNCLTRPGHHAHTYSSLRDRLAT
jgi:hypothetical protein